jgi:hypothetical protein
MTTTHIVIGTGVDSDVTKPVVLDSLKDIVKEDDVLAIAWVGGKPSDAMSWVYDFVINNGVAFVMFHLGGSKIPKVFTDSKDGSVVSVESMGKAYGSEISLDGKALVLGDDDITETWLLDTDAASPSPLSFLDLARGLVPITLSGGDDTHLAPEPTPEEGSIVVTDEDPTSDSGKKSNPEETVDIFSFSLAEMESMPARILKNIAIRTWGVGVEEPAEVEGIIAKVLRVQESRQEMIDKTGVLPEEHEKQDTTYSGLDDEVSAVYDQLLVLLRAKSEDAPARYLSLALTNLEQSALWYYYHDAPGLQGT